MLACVYGAYLIVGSKFNDQVALIWKYIYMGIYIWKYLACNIEPRFSFLLVQLWGWAEMKFLCRYTNNETCSPTSYAYIMRGRMHATVYVARSFNFFLCL